MSAIIIAIQIRGDKGPAHTGTDKERSDVPHKTSAEMGKISGSRGLFPDTYYN